MKVIYLDYNVIASIVGVPAQPDALAEHAAVRALQRGSARFALSAWTAFELARSADAEHVRRCCEFVESLNALWVSDFRYVIQQELARFLAQCPNHRSSDELPEVRALNASITQMWSTYGVHVPAGHGFRECVDALRSDATNIQTILNAAALTPPAIVVARQAHADGRAATLRQTIDREVFARRLGYQQADARIDFLMDHQARLYRESPLVAIEDALGTLRARDSFAPKLSHAADLQHAMAALAYCDGLVTRDGQLREHCRIVSRDLTLSRQIYARVGEVARSVVCKDAVIAGK